MLSFHLILFDYIENRRVPLQYFAAEAPAATFAILFQYI